jgi:hypothetical protein
MTQINRLAQALGYVKLAKQSLEPTAEFYEAWALEKLNEVESALITGITDMSTQVTPHETLQAEIQALKERVERLEYGALSKWAQEEVEEAPRQLTRDDIIEMAKRDVTHLQRRMATHIVQTEGNKWFQDYVTKAEFIVNREKRTVVALVRLNDIFEESNKVVSRGIAKCHPDDCFNAYIGRAIALRRALGLEVPDEYLNAPQPTEVRVGDFVRALNSVFKVVDPSEKIEAFGRKIHPNSVIAKGSVIIDDSRE